MPDSAQERTEKPTQRRLTTTRQEGNVPTSTEMLSAITLSVLVGTTALMGPKVVQWTMVQMKEGFSCDYSHFSDTNTFLAFANGKIVSAMGIMLPFFAMLILTGVLANITISGFNFTMKPLVWKLAPLNPIAGFKKLFSLSSFVRLILSVTKILFVSLIVYFYLHKRINSLATFQWAWSSQLLTVMAQLIFGVAIRLCIAMLILGVADLIYRKWQYIEKLKMSKQDVKDERKNYEGPPEIKRRIRQKQFEASMRRMLQEVPDAKVVLVNPTHVAVALKYEPEEMQAPVVVAKGGDHICERIKEVARAYGVPVIRRPALARTLFSTVKLGEPIPDSLFVAVAEVLALIYRLRRRR